MPREPGEPAEPAEPGELEAELACDSIPAKCEMREAVHRLLEQRGAGAGLGALGGVRFEPPRAFFERFLPAAAALDALDDEGELRPEERDAYRRVCRVGDAGVLELRPGQTVVAVGDIHGDLLAALAALRVARVITKFGRWRGGDSVVVFVGDLHDRTGRGEGPATTTNPREQVDITQYLYGLGRQARRAGGDVICLVGNHEQYQLEGPKQGRAPEVARFYDPKTEGYGPRKYTEYFGARTGLAAYMAQYCPCAVAAGPVLLLHGGLTVGVARQLRAAAGGDGLGPAVRALNAILARKVWEPTRRPGFSELYRRTVDEVLHTRTWWDGTCSQPRLNQVAEILQYRNPDAMCMVVGHTVQQAGIRPRCSGRFWGVDVGHSEAFGRRGGRPIEVLLFALRSPERRDSPHFCVVGEGPEERARRCYENGELVS